MTCKTLIMLAPWSSLNLMKKCLELPQSWSVLSTTNEMGSILRQWRDPILRVTSAEKPTSLSLLERKNLILLFSQVSAAYPVIPNTSRQYWRLQRLRFIFSKLAEIVVRRLEQNQQSGAANSDNLNVEIEDKFCFIGAAPFWIVLYDWSIQDTYLVLVTIQDTWLVLWAINTRYVTCVEHH